MESIILPFSYEDKQEELSFKAYSDLLKSTFKSIAWQVWKKDFDQKIFEKNLKFYDFSDTIWRKIIVWSFHYCRYWDISWFR